MNVIVVEVMGRGQTGQSASDWRTVAVAQQQATDEASLMLADDF